MSNPGGTTAVRTIDISEVIRGIGRRWKMLAAFTGISALLGLAFIMFSHPLYTSEAQILVEYQDSPYTRTNNGNLQLRPQIGDRDVRSQVAVIKSRDLALKTLKKLKLIGSPEFDALKRSFGIGSRLKVMLGFAPDPRRQTPEQRALTTWYKHLKAYNIPQTKIVVIEYSSRNPRVAAAVANTLAELYVEQTRRSKLEQTGEARDWLKDQIEKLRKKVVESEVAVERFRAEAGLFQGAQASLRQQELSELNSQIIKAQAERSQIQARARAIREMLRNGSVDSSSEVLRSPLIQRLREQQVRLQRKLAELSTTYLDNHPKVRAVRRELAGMKRQILAEARKIAAALEQQAKIATTREASLRASLAKIKAKVSNSSVNEVRLRELEREAKANRALLESFLARYTDASARDDTAALPGMARLVSRADVPSMPSFPRKGPIMILSVLAGLMLGLGVAFIIEVMAASSRLAKSRESAAGQRIAPAVAGTPAMTGASGMAQSAAPAGMSPASAGESATPPVASRAATSGSTLTAADFASLSAGMSASGQGDAAGASPMSPAPRGAEASSSPRREILSPAAPAVETAPAVDAPPATDTAASGPVESPPEPASENITPPSFADAPAVPGLPDDDMASELAVSVITDPQGPYAAALGPLTEWLGDAMAAGDNCVAFASLGGLCADVAAASLAVGRIIAGTGKRVMLLDASGGRDCLSMATGAQGGAGFLDLLAGQASFNNIVTRDAMSPLHMVHAGTPDNGAAMNDRQAMMAVRDALSQTYDLVIMLEGETSFPANRGQSVVPLCDLLVAAARGENGGAAEALCAAALQAGLKGAMCLRVNAPLQSPASTPAGKDDQGRETAAGEPAKVA